MSWFRKAAEQGAFNRYYNLGLLYENSGYGLPKDYVQAYVWYSLEIPLYSDDFNDIDRIRVAEKMPPRPDHRGVATCKGLDC